MNPSKRLCAYVNFLGVDGKLPGQETSIEVILDSCSLINGRRTFKGTFDKADASVRRGVQLQKVEINEWTTLAGININ